jgi:hypothetical protein
MRPRRENLYYFAAKIDCARVRLIEKGTAKIPSHLKSFCQQLTVVNLGLLAFSLFIFTLLALPARWQILYIIFSLALIALCAAPAERAGWNSLLLDGANFSIRSQRYILSSSVPGRDSHH